MKDNIAPVLIIAFNRPDLAAELINILRQNRVMKIYFAVDGPRPDRTGEIERCLAVRNLIKQFDWGCEVQTRFAEQNQGCKYGPANAINWFFDNVDSGIILEDDCHPVSDFFPFATELLVKFADDHRIGMISGHNFYQFQTDKTSSYYFSKLPIISGWATWRRAWAFQDVSLSRYRVKMDQIKASLGHSTRFRNYWWKYIDQWEAGLDSWAIPWAIALFANDMLCIKPAVNLISNQGYRDDSTHTSFEYDSQRYESTKSLAWPLVHPEIGSGQILVDEQADIKDENRYVGVWRRGLTWLGAKVGWPLKMLVKYVHYFESKARGWD
jgi:hypothetical protein